MNQILPYELKSYIILILTKKKNLLERLELMKIFLNNKDEYILNNIGKNITVYKNVIKYDLYKGLEKYIKIKNKIYTIDILAISGNIQKIEWWIDSGLYIYYSYRFLDNICLYKITIYFQSSQKNYNFLSSEDMGSHLSLLLLCLDNHFTGLFVLKKEKYFPRNVG